MTRILIADDHEMMRRGVRSVLESRPDVDVCEAQNGVEAVEKTKEVKRIWLFWTFQCPC